MTPASSTLVARLERLSRLQTEEECSEFLDIVGQLCRRQDPTVIDELLRIVDDGVRSRDVMAELWRGLEGSYPAKVFVPALLRNLQKMAEKAPESTFYLHARLLNSPDDDPSFALYLTMLPSLSSDARKVLLHVLEEDFEARVPDRLVRVRRRLAATS